MNPYRQLLSAVDRIDRSIPRLGLLAFIAAIVSVGIVVPRAFIAWTVAFPPPPPPPPAPCRDSAQLTNGPITITCDHAEHELWAAERDGKNAAFCVCRRERTTLPPMALPPATGDAHAQN